MKINLSLLVILLLTTRILQAQLPAFPGAEGFGKFARGARAATSPTVYRVTNLNDAGAGSLRDAVSQPNRIVVFDVAGVINISSRIVFSSNITVAGQTAPGDGVVVYGNGVSFSGAKDVIVRHMRFRMGTKGDSGKDAAGISNGTDMIFDHCSFTWGLDETFSISWDSKGTEPANITIQNSIIGQGIMTHSAGGLIQTNGGVTLYKNLYIDNKTRNPKVKGLNQYVNNVVYNWGSGGGYILGDSEGTSWATIENNYFVKGPSTGGTEAFVRANANFQLYQNNNYIDYTTDGVLNGRLAVNDDYGPATFVSSYSGFSGIPKPHPVISNQLSPVQAYQWIKDSVGAVLPARDEVDKYLIRELTSLGTMGALVNGEADLGLSGSVGNVFAAPKLPDTDGDGMPDAWEDVNGLNKTNSADATQIHESGYLNIERYINSIQKGNPYVKYPTALSVKAVDINSITLKWTNNAETATNIVVECSVDNSSFSEIARLSPYETQFKNENLNPNTTYYYRLKTLNGELASVYSATLKTATLGEAAPPVPCIDPVPADKSLIISYMQTTLQWTNLTGNWAGVLYYDIFMGTSPQNLEKIAAGKTAANLLVNILPNTTYYWRVDVTNLLGSVTGDVWSFTSGKKTEREKVAYFAMNETQGNVANNDIQGYATARNFTPIWNIGKVENCVTIPSSPSNAAFVQNHYDAISLGNESFSVEMWFKSAGGAVDWYLIHKGSHVKNTTTGMTGKWFGIQYNKTGTNDRFTWAIDDDVTKTDLNVTPGSTYFDNKWHHVVAIRDVEADQIRIYMDGVLKGSKTDGTGNIAQTEDLVIGNTNVNFVNAFGGSLDEISIYKGALTAEEVLENYNLGLKSGFANHEILQNTLVYPNPFVNDLHIKHSLLHDGQVFVRIHSLTGQVVYSATPNVENGSVYLTNLSTIPAGLYICTVKTPETEISVKVLK
jgi:hypothetical protein